MEEFIMFSSEIVVALWFVPVILFILIPLSMLGVWSVHLLMKRFTEKVERTVRNANAKSSKTPTPQFRPRTAI